MKFMILLHKVLYDYVTLFDVYEGAINPASWSKASKKAKTLMKSEFLLIGIEAFLRYPELEKYPFDWTTKLNRMKAPPNAGTRARSREHKSHT